MASGIGMFMKKKLRQIGQCDHYVIINQSKIHLETENQVIIVIIVIMTIVTILHHCSNCSLCQMVDLTDRHQGTMINKLVFGGLKFLQTTKKLT